MSAHSEDDPVSRSDIEEVFQTWKNNSAKWSVKRSQSDTQIEQKSDHSDSQVSLN